jgi:uncharacterized protein YdiU (UPF0061 family)
LKAIQIGPRLTGVHKVSQVYVSLLREVCERTGRLVAAWQSLGFVHGVLNTDNMSILGECGRGGDLYGGAVMSTTHALQAFSQSLQGQGFMFGCAHPFAGLTIDYGPFGFLDAFDPYYTPNLTDYEGRR